MGRKRGRREAYRIEYDNEARSDLRELAAPARERVVDAIEAQLPYEPAVTTRNRFRADRTASATMSSASSPTACTSTWIVGTAAWWCRPCQAVLYEPRETAYRRGKEIDTHGHDRA